MLPSKTTKSSLGACQRLALSFIVSLSSLSRQESSLSFSQTSVCERRMLHRRCSGKLSKTTILFAERCRGWPAAFGARACRPTLHRLRRFTNRLACPASSTRDETQLCSFTFHLLCVSDTTIRIYTVVVWIHDVSLDCQPAPNMTPSRCWLSVLALV